MKQENNKYQFRALTEKQFALVFLLILPFYGMSLFLMNRYLFYDETGYGVLTNIKTLGLPLIVAFILMICVGTFFVSKMYTLQFNNGQLLLSSEKGKFNFPLDKIDKIEFVQPRKYKVATFKIYMNEKKMIFIIGYFVLRVNHFYKSKTQLQNFVADSLLHGFKSKVEHNEHNINQTLIKY